MSWGDSRKFPVNAGRPLIYERISILNPLVVSSSQPRLADLITQQRARPRGVEARADGGKMLGEGTELGPATRAVLPRGQDVGHMWLQEELPCPVISSH